MGLYDLFYQYILTQETSLVMLVLHAPLEILVAVVFGLFWGLLVTYLPPQPQPSSGIR